MTWQDRGVSCGDMARQGGVVRRHGKTGGCRAACRVMLGLDVYANYVVPCMSCDELTHFAEKHTFACRVMHVVPSIARHALHDMHHTTPLKNVFQPT